VPGACPERGIALVSLVFTILVLAVVAAGLAELASTAATSSVESRDSLQAALAAEAGLVRALREAAAAPVPVAFGGAAFTVSIDSASQERYVATGLMSSAARILRTDRALVAVLGSRPAATADTVEFRLVNLSGAARTLESVRVSWGSPAAYIEEVRLRIVGGVQFGPVWTHSNAGGNRLGSGELGTFNAAPSPVVLPAGATLGVRLLRFRSAETGAGAAVSMDSTPFRVEFRTATKRLGDATVKVP